MTITQGLRHLSSSRLGLARASSLFAHRQEVLRTMARASPILQQRDISIGILRENYDKWERRTPLCPNHVKDLIDTFKGTSQLTDVYVQPASHRIFPDSQYVAAGAKISKDLSEADILLGVKRVADESDLLPEKTYMFFSHVIKGQPENMGLLQAILDKKVQLIDYEAIAEEITDPSTGKTKKRRLVAFGKYAGIAGMIDTFQCLGRRLLASGFSTPFLNCSPAYIYYDLDDAKRGIKEMGKRIANDGLPMELEPLVFAFTGRGNVTQGALEIFKLLPHKMISLEEAKSIKNQPGPHKCVYGVMVEQKDLVKKANSDDPLDVKHYRENPSEYESIFKENVAPVCNVIVNGIYWDERYPRLLTKEDISDLYKNGNKGLFTVGDISCDVNGSIEFLERTTTIDKPFFLWNPVTNEATDEITGDGVAVMGVDILPTELSVESSKHFGDALLPMLKQVITNWHGKEDNSYENLPQELANACIAENGSLTPNYEYINALMKRSQVVHHPISDPHILLRIKGHLFDSGLINQILDVIEGSDCHFEIEDCTVKRTVNGVREKSVLMLRVFSDDDEKLDSVLKKVTLLIDLIDAAEGSMQHYENRPQSMQSKSSSDQKVTVFGEREKNVLVLGAGRVASSLAEYLGRSKTTTITVASQYDDEAMEVASNAIRGKAVTCDLSQPGEQLKYLIEEADIVVSLLPAPFHPVIANECISLKTDLVTASYESDEMRALHSHCEEAGIAILNEVGLDPGMDHMSAMKIIDDVHSRGGEITSFSSVCGGLPAPEVADTNPLLYKFSWSPMGVIKASQNSATFLRDGEIVGVDGANLLANAEPFDAWQSLHLECLPNRDSLIYGKKYGIENASSIFRGTLRYHGFSSLLHVFKVMGLLDDKETEASTWHDTLRNLQKKNGCSDLRSYVASCSGGDKELASRAYNCLTWLGLKDQVTVSQPTSIVKSFCDILEQKLQFEEGERDMVLMHHDIKASFDDGSSEHHSCSLQLFGDDNMTAMCKTVGYTAAIGTQLILDGGITSKGLLLPTSKNVYIPALELIKKENINFDEQVHYENEYDEVV